MSQAFDWAHGVYLGATLGSEATAAAAASAAVRRDPMAMLPFCGYDMGDYFTHWLGFERRLREPPPIFRVSWFLRDDEGRFAWPGYGQNLRVLDWIVRRARGEADAVTSPVGWQLTYDDLDWTGLALSGPRLESLIRVDRDATLADLDAQAAFFERFTTLPEELLHQRELAYERLRAPSHTKPARIRRAATMRRGSL